MNRGRRKEITGIEQARDQVIAYEQEAVEAEFALHEFKAENGEDLAAIKSEFEDYKKHPLWQEHHKKQAATDSPAETYRYWSLDNADSLGWEQHVLYPYRRFYGSMSINLDDPDRSVIPVSAEEFDRRVTLASHVGKVAAILEAHQGEPIVSIAGYDAKLAFHKAAGARIKRRWDEEYYYGYVSQLPKTRAVVGTVNQTGRDPVIATEELPAEEEGGAGTLRLTLADSVAGTVSAYSLPSSKAQLKRQTEQPYYIKVDSTHKRLPLGDSLIGDFPLEKLKGHDLVVIDGPHRTAASHEFSDDIVLYRPKQKIEHDSKSRNQEVVVTSHPSTKLYEATVISEDGEVVLPSFRHDTTWLIGTKAIDAYLADTILGVTPSVSQRRRTHWAILRATRDLAKFAGNNRPVAELAA